MLKAFEWEFLQEPIYRWFIFAVIMLLFLGVWKMTLEGYMK